MTIELLLRRSSRPPATSRRSPSRGAASTRWRRAASTTSWAAGSTATRPTRAGSCRTSSRCSTTTPSSPACTRTRGRSPATDAYLDDGDGRPRLPAARAADGRRRVRREPGRGHRRRGGRDVRLVRRRRSARSSGAARRRAVLGRVRGHRRRQLGGPDDPVARPRRRRARASGSGSRPRVVAERLAAARGRARSRGARAGRSPRATTRCWRPGTASRSRRSRTRRGARRDGRPGPRGVADRYRDAAVAAAGAVARRPARRPRAACADRGRTAGLRRTACSRTTRTSRTGCSPCTRRPSTSAGSRRRGASSTSSLERFADPAGGFFDTADDGERLVVRPKDLQDNATPSGNAMATTVLLRLAALTGEGRYRAAAERALATVGPYLARYPTGVRAVAVRARARPRGDLGGRDRRAPGRPGHRGAPRCRRAAAYRPFRGPRRPPSGPMRPASPCCATGSRSTAGATAFVCRDFACRQPVHEPEALEALLLGA